MTPSSPDLAQLLKRIERLEQQNRRLKRAGIATFVMGASLLLMGQAKTSKTIEAEQFILKDGKGAKWAALYLTETGPKFHMYGPDGKVRRALGASSYSGGLALYTPDGNTRVTLAVSETDMPWVDTPSPQDSIALVVAKSGPRLVLSDERGFEAHVGITPLFEPKAGRNIQTSAASLVLFGKDAKVLWSAP